MTKSAVGRVVDVARIQMVNWRTILGWPLGVLAIVFAMNWVLFVFISDVAPPEGRVTTLALMSIYIVMAVTHLQTITQLFPFALGISVTRRAFYGGTALIVLGQALGFGLLLVLLELLERATGGWGLQLKFFGLGFLTQDNPLAQWLIYTVPFLALSAISIAIGVVFKRWGQTGIYVLSIGSTVFLVAVSVLLTTQQWWPAVGSFFTQPTLALFAGYPLVITMVAGVAGYLLLRRATP